MTDAPPPPFAYATAFETGSLAPLSYNREQCPNGLKPRLADGVLTLAVQTDTYEATDGSNATNDRCELRDREKLPMGTVAFYGFDMRVVPPFPVVDARFVCCQLKGSYDDNTGGSPLVALRIESGRFLLTAELLFEEGDERFILPADDPDSWGGRVLDHADFADPAGHQLRVVMATDPDGLPDSLRPSYDRRCSLVSLRPHNNLPCLDDAWHRWVFRCEPSPVAGYDGIVEVWCDGKPIATAVGQLGRGKDLSWFKWGPYRDKDPAWGSGPAALQFRAFKRGSSLADVA